MSTRHLKLLVFQDKRYRDKNKILVKKLMLKFI
jgi:hypothetical protein